MNIKPIILKAITPLLLFSSLFTQAGTGSDPSNPNQSLKIEQAFIRNSGQVITDKGKPSEEVLYYTQLNNATVFFRNNAVSYTLYNSTKPDAPSAHTVQVTFANSNQQATVSCTQPVAATYNFYTTASPQPITGVAGYRELTYHNLYPNIDLVYRISDRSVKYDIVAHPGAKLSDIRFQIDGAEKLSVKDNKIRIATTLGEIVDEIPVSYYDDAAKTKVDFIELQQQGNEISFKEAAYDAQKTLVIDPVLNFFNNFGPATNGSGGSGVSIGNSIYHEEGLGTTIVGHTNSTIFYQAPGAAYTSGPATQLGFMSFFSSAGVMQWSTTLQGDRSIVLNDVISMGSQIFACGTTYDQLPGLPPINTNAYMGTVGISNGFLSMINTSGVLTRNYYIGGDGEDGATCITGGGYYGGILVGGYSYSSTMNSLSSIGYPRQSLAASDGFVMSLKPDMTPSFTNVGYTFLGSNQEDVVTDIAYMTSTDKVVVTGTTKATSIGFTPLLTNVYGTSGLTGDNDVFAMSLLLPTYTGFGSYVADYTAFIGTDAGEEVMPRVCIRFDNSLSALNDFDIAFVTNSSGLNAITTINAYQKNITAGFYNHFYVSLNATLNTVKYASYFRRTVSSPPTSPLAVKVDWLGNKFLSGTTNEAAFPLTQNITVNNKVPGTPAGNTTDIFLARLNPDFTLGYMALTGDDNPNYVNEIDVTRDGEDLCATEIYMTGATPLSSGVTYAIHAKITDSNPLSLTSSNGTTLPSTLSISQGSLISAPASVQWYFNGMPYGDAQTELPPALSTLVNLPGSYYAVITYKGCTFTTQTINFAIDCGGARRYTDLRLYINEQIALGNTEIEIWEQNFQIKAGEVVTIPSGRVVSIYNSTIVAMECSRIEVQGTGVLNIDGSVLTACNRWDGVLYNGSGTSGAISNTGISNAVVAVYKYYGSAITGPTLTVNTSNFNNNTMHAAVLSTYAGGPVAGTGNNLFEHNKMFSLVGEKCGSTSPYTVLKSNAGGYSCYLFGMGLRTGFLMVHENYFYGTTLSGTRFVTIKGRNLTNNVYNYNKYRGQFRSAVDINSSISIACHYEHVKCDLTDYAYRMVNTTTENGIAVENSYIENTGSAAIAGISMKNTHRNTIATNEIKGFTNGIEYYNSQYLPFITLDHSKRSDIRYNIIWGTRSGVVLSYTQDPYTATLGSNNSPANYQLGVWVRCNMFIGGNYGILGSGYLINQLIDVPGSPTNSGPGTFYYDPGNVFSGVANWDIIWDNAYNGGASGFTYYAPLANTPGANSPNLVVLNGHNRGLGFTNDYFATPTTPAGTVQQLNCAPSPDQHTPQMRPTGLLNKEEANGNAVAVYPNPSRGTFTVEFKGQQPDRIEVMDLLGRQVYSSETSGKAQLEINGSSWTPGVYFIRLYNQNTVIGTQKVLREN